MKIIEVFLKLRYLFTSKDVALIPNGNYCYDTISRDPITYKATKTYVCPYYRRYYIGGRTVSWCTYVNNTDGLCLDDMVKICFENDEYQEDEDEYEVE